MTTFYVVALSVSVLSASSSSDNMLAFLQCSNGFKSAKLNDIGEKASILDKERVGVLPTLSDLEYLLKSLIGLIGRQTLSALFIILRVSYVYLLLISCKGEVIAITETRFKVCFFLSTRSCESFPLKFLCYLLNSSILVKYWDQSKKTFRMLLVGAGVLALIILLVGLCSVAVTAMLGASFIENIFAESFILINVGLYNSTLKFLF